MADLDLIGKNVVVTGASAGVGRAVALAFAEHGANVAVLARDMARLESLRREVEALDVKALPIAMDVADADQVERAAARVEEEWGHIDVWVNSAMTTVMAPVREMTAAEYQRVINVTFMGYVHGTLSALKRMLPRDRGVIVQVGSALAYRGIPLQSAYCAAKHAIQGFHDSLTAELLHDGSNVHVTMVQLGAHNTPQFDWARNKMPRRAQPVPLIYQPEVAARAVVWAATHRRKEWTVTFSAFTAIWGDKLFSSLGDRYLARTGYEGQMTDDPETGRPDNLFATVEGDFGAHGRYDAVARDRSAFFWLDTHKGWLLWAVAGGLTWGVTVASAWRALRKAGGLRKTAFPHA